MSVTFRAPVFLVNFAFWPDNDEPRKLSRHTLPASVVGLVTFDSFSLSRSCRQNHSGAHHLVMAVPHQRIYFPYLLACRYNWGEVVVDFFFCIVFMSSSLEETQLPFKTTFFREINKDDLRKKKRTMFRSNNNISKFLKKYFSENCPLCSEQNSDSNCSPGHTLLLESYF